MSPLDMLDVLAPLADLYTLGDIGMSVAEFVSGSNDSKAKRTETSVLSLTSPQKVGLAPIVSGQSRAPDLQTAKSVVADLKPLHSPELKLPELKLVPDKAFIGEPFCTSIEIPKELGLKNPSVEILSPVAGRINLKDTGLVELRFDAVLEPKAGAKQDSLPVSGLKGDPAADAKFIQDHGSGIKAITRIDIRALKPIPESARIQGQNIPAAFNFPIIITDQGKPVAKSSIEIARRQLDPPEKKIMDEVNLKLAKGSFTASYRLGESTIEIKYNQSTRAGKFIAGIKELWKMIRTGKGTHPLEGLLNTEKKTPEQRAQAAKDKDASTDYLNIKILDAEGKVKTRFNAWNDYLGMPNRWGAGIVGRGLDGGYSNGSLGGGFGPIFNSASEFATFALNNFAFPSQEKFGPKYFTEPSMTKSRENNQTSLAANLAV